MHQLLCFNSKFPNHFVSPNVQLSSTLRYASLGSIRVKDWKWIVFVNCTSGGESRSNIGTITLRMNLTCLRKNGKHGLVFQRSVG